MIKLLPVFVLFLLSCNEVHIQTRMEPETTISDMEASDTTTIINRIYFDFTYEDTVIKEFPGEKPNQIRIDYQFKNKGIEYYSREEAEFKNCRLKDQVGLELPKDFKRYELLPKLFSNRLTYLVNDDETDSILVSWWKCTSCASDSIPYFRYYGYGIEFPDSTGNTSFITGDYRFSLKNKNYRLISFASYPGESALMFLGRFSGGMMGHALFEVREDKCVLIDLNRKVGVYGTYNYPLEPEISIAFDDLFLIYEFTNGGVGGPFTKISDIYYFTGNKLQHLMAEDFLMLYSSRVGEWKTQFQFYRDSIHHKTGIKLITSGWFVGNGYGSEGDYSEYFNPDEIPIEFELAVKSADITRTPFEFVLEREYLYVKDSTYRTKKFHSKKLNGKWITERIKKN